MRWIIIIIVLAGSLWSGIVVQPEPVVKEVKVERIRYVAIVVSSDDPNVIIDGGKYYHK